MRAVSTHLPRWRARTALLGAAIVVAAPLTISVPALAEPASLDDRPFIQDVKTVPTYSYADAIRESVRVEGATDYDQDGERDQIAVDLIRPREAADEGVDVPVIIVPSPYYGTIGRGNESELKEYGPDGTITTFPLFYDNYFVPRGYAVALVDMKGTTRSEGCLDVGGQQDVESVKATVDWLNGRTSAEFLDGTPAVADWTNGKAGVVGKSWDGTLANGVAATGVEGLETIVPISAISSWYDYLTYNGVPRGGPGTPFPFYHDAYSGREEGVCDERIDEQVADSDYESGNYNAFWGERNYLPKADDVQASVFLVHGVNDINVDAWHVSRWWDALRAENVPVKMWLSQVGHVEPFDYRRAEWVATLHRWFDYWLHDLDNGIMDEPPVSIERRPGQWVEQADWPSADENTTLRLGPGNGVTGTLGESNPPRAVVSYTDDPELTEAEAVTDPNTRKDGRLVFLTSPLDSDVHLSGTPSVTLRVRVDQATTELSARMVDYGTSTRYNHTGPGEGIRTLDSESCWGESTEADDACYFDTAPDVITSDLEVLSRGWIDAAHHASLTDPTPLQPDQWYTMTIPLQPEEKVLPAGHVLGLVVTASDEEFTFPTPTGATVEVDLHSSELSLPVATGLPVATATPPQVEAYGAPQVTSTPGTAQGWPRPR